MGGLGGCSGILVQQQKLSKAHRLVYGIGKNNNKRVWCSLCVTFSWHIRSIMPSPNINTEMLPPQSPGSLSAYTSLLLSASHTHTHTHMHKIYSWLMAQLYHPSSCCQRGEAQLGVCSKGEFELNYSQPAGKNINGSNLIWFYCGSRL